MITYSYNMDKSSVKKSMRWLVDLIFGGSDDMESVKKIEMSEISEIAKQ